MTFRVTAVSDVLGARIEGLDLASPPDLTLSPSPDATSSPTPVPLITLPPLGSAAPTQPPATQKAD